MIGATIYLGCSPNTDSLEEYVKVITGDVNRELPSFVKRDKEPAK